MQNNGKVKIVVIDSGIDCKFADLGNYVVKSFGFELDDKGYIIETRHKEIKNIHGTVISLIIRHVCSSIELISFNILNEHLATDGRIMIYALEQALRFWPQIIHLSIGTMEWRHKFDLEKIVRISKKNNIVIVAATHPNENLTAYPACLKGVVGVKAGIFEDNLKYFCKNGFLYAPSSAKNVPGVAEAGAKYAKGTSISAAYITGHIARIMSEKKLVDTSKIKEMIIMNQSEEEKNGFYNGYHG